MPYLGDLNSTRRAFLLVSFVTFFSLSVVAGRSHRCHNNHFQMLQPIVGIDSPAPSPPTSRLSRSKNSKSSGLDDQKNEAHNRRSLTPLEGPHPLRITVIYDYFDKPSKDKYTNGLPRTCGEDSGVDGIYITTDMENYLSYKNTMCVGSNDSYVENCYFKCTKDDRMSNQRILIGKEELASVIEELGNLINVYHDTASITIGSRAADAPGNGSCGGVGLEEQTLENFDFALIVTARPLGYLKDVLAVASTCRIDTTTGRPILGHMNIAPSALENLDLKTVLLHEMIHALGFNTRVYPEYRIPEGDHLKKYMEDPARFPSGPLQGPAVVLSGDSFTVNYTLLGPGKKLYVVTPTVRQVGKDYFGLGLEEEFIGVELENGGNSSGTTATHWEKRILFFELMGASQNLVPGVLSRFTLAFLNDMGFYSTDYTKGKPMNWGYKEGGSWVKNSCQGWPSNYRCNTVRLDGGGRVVGECGYDGTFIGKCNVVHYPSPLPEAYRYFPNDEKKGGSDELADACPIVQQVMRLKENVVETCATASVDSVSGSRGGSSSRCFEADVANNTYLTFASKPNCFQVFCVGEVPWVRIGDSFYPCNVPKFQLIFPPWHAAYRPPVQTTYYTSHDFNGTFSCGIVKGSQEQDSPFINVAQKQCRVIQSHLVNPVTQLDSTPQYDWPQILDTVPESASTEGGTVVTVNGRSLDNCTKLRLGGLMTANYTLVSSTKLLVSTNPLPPKSAVTGFVDVELFCTHQHICPEGCFFGRLLHRFNFTVPPKKKDLATAAFDELMASPLGKGIGAAVGLVVIVIIAVTIKSCFCGHNGAKQQQGVKRTAGGNNKQFDRGGYNLDAYEEELL